jgi:PAS domain-containing protein
MELETLRTEWCTDGRPADAGAEHELLMTRQLTAAVAIVLQHALPVRAALVIAAPRPTAALSVGALVLTEVDLGGGRLRRALGCASDHDALAAELKGLGPSTNVEHAVGHDRSGAVVGIVAVFPGVAAAIPRERTLGILARAAAGIAGWSTAPQRGPARALLDAIDDPALVHRDGVVVLVNPALADMLGATPEQLIGQPVTELAPRLPPHPRAPRLFPAGEPSQVLLYRGGALRARVAECVARAIAGVYPTVRPWTKIINAASSDATVTCAEAALVELVTLAALDVATGLHGGGAVNRLRISTVERDRDVVIEIEATGPMVHLSNPADHLAAAACARRVAMLGGALELEAGVRDRRVLRLVLPQEVA